MDEALYDEMFRVESVYWWFVAKRRIILSLLEKYLPVSPSSPGPRVCDIGCGCGMTLRELQDHGYQAVGVDASDTALSYCAARGVQAVKGSLPDHLGLPPGQADAVLLLDVLEHLDDDRAAMLAAFDLLRPGGFLIATVPAYQWLWTRRDEFHHHKRRYSMARWRQLLDDATARCGARPLMVSYFNTYLFPLALAGRLASKLLPQPDRPGDMSIPPLGINRLLAGIFASERLSLCAGFPLPFGLSLLAVMQKPVEGTVEQTVAQPPSAVSSPLLSVSSSSSFTLQPQQQENSKTQPRAAVPHTLANPRDTSRPALYWLAVAMLICSCAYFAVRGPWRALRDPAGASNLLTEPAGAKDLRVYYCASRAWLLGKNPYNQEDLQQINLQAGGHTNGVDTSLNLPPCLVPLSIIGGIPSWHVARIVWTALGVLLTVVCLWQLSVLLQLRWSSAGTVMFWAVGLALAPFHTDIAEGQLSILVTTAVILALRCQVEKHPKMAGVMLGLAVAIKPTMALLLPVMLLFRGHLRMLVYVVFTCAILTGLSIGKMHMAGIQWLPYLKQNLETFSQGGRGDVTGPTSYLMIHLEVVLAGIFGDPKTIHIMAAAMVALLGAAGLLAVRGLRDRQSELLLWGLFSLLCLMAFYNRLYSATLLVLPLAWAMRNLTRPGMRGVSWVMLLLILPFLVPGAAALATWFPQLATMPGGGLFLHHQVFLLAFLAIAIGYAGEKLRKMENSPKAA